MAISQYDVKGVVDRAVNNAFGMPEFQRGFMWTPTRVRDLVESLYLDYPIGALLLWYPDFTPPAKTDDSAKTDLWVVDGQQRTTAMCLLFGRKPYWWQDNENQWNEKLNKYDIHVKPLPESEEVKFEIPKRAVLRDPGYVSVREILRADDDRIQDLTARLHEHSPDISEINILMKLQRVRDIGTRDISAFVVDKDLENTVEIFIRLNQNGVKVREGDIYTALIASYNPNWRNQTLNPFMDDLENYGFELEPTIILRSLIAASTGRTRFKDVDRREFWSGDNLNNEWPKVEKAWRAVINELRNYGILNSDLFPSKNALIPLIVMAARFEKDFHIEPALAWLLRATCTNRYSRTTDTRLAEDIRFIREGSDFNSAVRNAIKHLDELDFAADDNEYFNKRYRDGSVQLIMYLLAYENEAHDWGASNERIGFAGSSLLQKFNPDWHHIFPRAYLKSAPAFDEVDSAANIVAIRKDTNLKIGSKAPMEYMEGISDKLLQEQYVPTDRSLFSIDRYNEFIERRAANLAIAANNFMDKLTDNG